ncbi:hypothetical protein F7725_023957 [Dissostichus mawsoni]|uniref:Phosphatidylcholine:ceramide cholinephosphotransferase 1 n=1 Tax=Dissostichus mawsoni TaxID=36200 RepID=A0A7J5XXZ3_DISMA|nr:hypothetical protein F7725_023957 [Dissostichus mawsoni]
MMSLEDPPDPPHCPLAKMKKVAAWSAEDVYDWLSKEGMLEYIDALRQTDGPGLLRLNEADFHRPPLSLVSSDGGQQLLERLETLRIETHIEDHKNGHANGHAGGLPNGTSKPQRNGMKDYRMEMVHISIPTKETTRPSFPTEWGKTGIAFAYAVVCFVTTTIVISVVHERVPPKEHTPPLPDKFFDLFNRVEWAFSICEINGMLLVNYRQAILLHCGNTLSVPVYYNVHHHSACSRDALQMLSKASRELGGADEENNEDDCWWGPLHHRVPHHVWRLSVQWPHSHANANIPLHQGVFPKRFWWYHWFCWSLSAVGIFCILLAHDHYTVDVVVAYFITTRLFWWYHTMANQQSLKETSQSNPFSRVWWYRLFQFFEENVSGMVPRNYQLPLSWRSLQWSRGVKYSKLEVQ